MGQKARNHNFAPLFPKSPHSNPKLKRVPQCLGTPKRVPLFQLVRPASLFPEPAPRWAGQLSAGKGGWGSACRRSEPSPLSAGQQRPLPTRITILPAGPQGPRVSAGAGWVLSKCWAEAARARGEAEAWPALGGGSPRPQPIPGHRSAMVPLPRPGSQLDGGSPLPAADAGTATERPWALLGFPEAENIGPPGAGC